MVAEFKWRNGKNKRKILLLSDNAPENPRNLELDAIELLFNPPNCTSKIQPLDQGIIKAFKDHYWRHVLNELVAADFFSLNQKMDSQMW